MTLYLNDLSFVSDKHILENWEAIKALNELVNELATRRNDLCLHAPEDLWRKVLSGYDLNTNTPKISKEHCQYLRFLFHKFVLTDSGYPRFSMDESFSISSSSMGCAAAEDAPVISFVFDEQYAMETLTGWVKYSEQEHVKSKELNNLSCIENRAWNNRFVVDVSSCASRNPLAEPMWNVDLVQPIVEKADLINQDSRIRQSLLFKYGKIVAEMNGWKYNPKLTKINSNPNKLRYIFDSKDIFTNYRIAYLSIDMEGPDLAFEVCDRKGKHQGECSWDGSWKTAKKGHDIKLKS